MSLPALPDAKSITPERARAYAVAIEMWAKDADDIAAVKDTQAKVSALETYLRRRNKGAAVEMARAARKLEVRVGVLLGEAERGGDRKSESFKSHASDLIPKNDRYRLRQMADHAHDPAVIAAIERGASRAQVLRATRAAEEEAVMAEAKEEAEQINKRFASRVGDRQENADASRQRGEFSRLCRDIAALPTPGDFIDRHRRYLTDEDADEAQAAHAWLDDFLKQWRH